MGATNTHMDDKDRISLKIKIFCNVKDFNYALQYE